MKFKSLSTAMLFAAISATAFAQAPTVTAPKPQVDASKVASCFSDAYESTFQLTPVEGKFKGSFKTVELASGEHVLKMDDFTYAHFGLGSEDGTTTIDVSNYDRLHFDIFKPLDSSFHTAIQPGLSGSSTAYTGEQALTPGQWISADIKIADFQAAGLSAIKTLLLKDKSNKIKGTLYIDNVFFYKGEPVAPLPGDAVDPEFGGGDNEEEEVDPTAPTVSAPTPTHDQEKVKSAFSDAYTAFTKWDYAGYGAAMSNLKINGNDNITKLAGGWAAISVGGRNVADMESLHLDVYSAGITDIRVGFSTWSGGEKYADNFITATPQGQWTSINIPLSDISGYDFANTQVMRITVNGTGAYFLDNVYFYTTKEAENTLPTKAAPKPLVEASLVGSCYSDAYQPTFNFDGYNSNGCVITSKEISSGEHVLEVKDFRWLHFALGETPAESTVDLSGYDRVHFDAYVPSNNVTATVQPGMYNVATKKEAFSGAQTLKPGEWISVDLKMADFQAVGLTEVYNLTFKDPAGKTGLIYLDNVYFYKEDEVKPVEIPAAPTPTHAQSDVKAFFSDAYTLTGKFEIPKNPEYDKNGLIEIINIGTEAQKDEVAKITNLNWRVVNLGVRDVSDKGYLHVDYYSPVENGVTSVCINLTNWDTKNGSAYELDGDQQNYRTLKPGEWTSFDIPLNNFHSTDPSKEFNFATDMACVRFYAGDGSRGKTLYVDNFYFWGEPQEDTGGDGETYEPIQDSTDGELPPMTTPMLGVNLASASGGTVPGRFGTDYMYPRFEDLYYFKAKGVRLIRFPFRAARVVEDITNPTQLDTEDLNALKAVVAEAERLGIWIFLDAHDYAERTTNGTQDLLGTGEYTIERFGQMWGAIAKEFAQYSNIWGYDLQNEPKVSAQVLVNAYQAAIDEIRKVDTSAQIIVEGTNWASAYEWIYGDREDKNYPEYSSEVAWSYKKNSPWLLTSLNDPQKKIVYEAHGYFDADNSGTYKNGYKDVDYRKRFLPFLEWCKTNNATALMGEFGVPYNEHSTGDPRYMEVLDGALQLFREYQVNATYWCAGAMYEGNSLTCQPDKSPLYGNYAKEKSTMGVLEKYFEHWAFTEEDSNGVEDVIYEDSLEGDGRIYNIMGIEVDENYKGFVIKNGKKYLQK